MNVIGEKSAFYGYLIGLQLERSPESDVSNRRLYATFEYTGEVKVWEVPDEQLFEVLSGHLCAMAALRKMGEYGYNKLWIEKKGWEWRAYLP